VPTKTVSKPAIEDQGFGTILWRGRYLILATLVLTVSVATILVARTDKVYEATGIMQVDALSTIAPGGDQLALQQAAADTATSYATVIGAPGFLERIRNDVLGGRLTAAELDARVSSKPIITANNLSTNLIELKAEGSSPSEARKVAMDVANAFVETVRSDALKNLAKQQGQIQQQIASITTRIGALRRSGSAKAGVSEQLTSLRATRADLTRQLATVVANGIARAGNVHTAAAPVASTAPVRPRPILNIAVAMMLGLVAGFAIAWLRTVLDTRLHSAEEAERMLDVPMLASIPLRKEPSRHDPVLREAYDVLRANLTFLALDSSLKVLAVTSHSPGEGKTSTLEGLAQSAIRTGSSALLIDGDVRTRALSMRFGKHAAVGLTNVIARVDLPLRAPNAGNTRVSVDGIDEIVSLAPGLDLLPAGTSPPNPPSLLGSERMAALIARLRGSYDTILIDTPPSSHLADASILASLADGVILLARVGLTKRTDLRTVAASLRHGPTPIVGVVVLEPRTVDLTYYDATYMRSPSEPKAVSSP